MTSLWFYHAMAYKYCTVLRQKRYEQPFGFSGFPDNFLNPVIFAESPQLTDELDFNAVFICDALCVCTDLFRKGWEKSEKSKIRMLLAFR